MVFVCSVVFYFVRNGPLEKLWRGRGGWIFELHDFFSLTFHLQEYFFPYARTFFLGYLLCINYFSLNFPLRDFFCHFVFSNGPFLKVLIIQKSMGPLHDLVTWYRIRQAGWQMAQWDIKNKEMTAIHMLIPLSFASQHSGFWSCKGLLLLNKATSS